ncbi:uncharacterized protein LOC113758618 [Coffea eugenioides]|uniref:uncharacterized protein LOC113758618 n=1 Tax=Coffea eugenioides TaxID=49369 RepID=UPI000F60AC66|nr:uncharacterized protein LOC113758618 [Coffea eugenioides]
MVRNSGTIRFKHLNVKFKDRFQNDMIQPQTHLNVADNSRARELMCIQIIGASNLLYAHIGDVIVAVIKEAVPNMTLESGVGGGNGFERLSLGTKVKSISKARTRIHLLSTLLPETSSVLSFLANSDRPARSLLLSSAAYSSISSSLSSPSSGSDDDSLCLWLYDTFLSADSELRLVVLCYISLLSSFYLSRIHSSSTTSAISPTPNLAGFEAVLLVLYSSEVKAHSGIPVLISIPDLSQPSLYHSSRNPPSNKSNPINNNPSSRPLVGVLSPPLEPQMAVKSTKRASIVGIALDCYYKQISQMPSWSKLDFCKFLADWASQDCPCKSDFDDFTTQKPDNFTESSHGLSGDSRGHNEIEDVVEEIRHLRSEGRDDELRSQGVRIPLPWELLQPALRILGHCLLGHLITEDVKAATSVAIRSLYAGPPMT